MREISLASIKHSTHVFLVGFHVLWLTEVTAAVRPANQLLIIIYRPLQLLVYLILFFN